MGFDPATNSRVQRVDRCLIRLATEPWPFMSQNHAAALAHFERRKLASPGFFNGQVAIGTHHAFDGPAFSARMKVIDFATFLYWREQCPTEALARDIFGSALVRSCEGYVLLGRQSAGNLNAGVAYAPGGFIDPRDVGDGDKIDIDKSICRELKEETRLEARELEATPGYIVTEIGRQISIAVEFTSKLKAHDLRARILADAERESEIEDIVIVEMASELPKLKVAPYAQALVQVVLATKTA